MQAEPLTPILQQTLTLVGLAMELGRERLPLHSPAVAARMLRWQTGK